ncbi:MAG: beta-ketoacyl synthase chain length factor [Candidatus Adiutrix sp.]|jgi:hypothetical protein|nr:beta-ketoacyl synthase chain length factor [Candidatus Adiutrix sp.]
MLLKLEALGGLSPAGTLEEVRAGRRWSELFNGDLAARLCDPSYFKELAALYPGTQLRRAPRLARLALRAAAGLAPGLVPPEKRALVLVTAYASVGSTFEFLDSLLDDGPPLASPTAFSHSVTNMSAAILSQNLDIQGLTLTLTQNDFHQGLEAAGALLQGGLADTVLLGALGEIYGLMPEIEKLARPGGPPPLSDGAIFLSLSPGSPDQKGPPVEFNAPAYGDQGPLAQAWRLASLLAPNPARTVRCGPGRLEIQTREAGS